MAEDQEPQVVEGNIVEDDDEAAEQQPAIPVMTQAEIDQRLASDRQYFALATGTLTAEVQPQAGLIGVDGIMNIDYWGNWEGKVGWEQIGTLAPGETPNGTKFDLLAARPPVHRITAYGIPKPTLPEPINEYLIDQSAAPYEASGVFRVFSRRGWATLESVLRPGVWSLQGLVQIDAGGSWRGKMGHNVYPPTRSEIRALKRQFAV